MVSNEEYDVLVSSDAIGMGLNLRIRRVVFWTVQKFNWMEKDFQVFPQLGKLVVEQAVFFRERRAGEFVIIPSERLVVYSNTMNRSISKLEQAGIWPAINFGCNTFGGSRNQDIEERSEIVLSVHRTFFHKKLLFQCITECD